MRLKALKLLLNNRDRNKRCINQKERLAGARSRKGVLFDLYSAHARVKTAGGRIRAPRVEGTHAIYGLQSQSLSLGGNSFDSLLDSPYFEKNSEI